MDEEAEKIEAATAEPQIEDQVVDQEVAEDPIEQQEPSSKKQVPLTALQEERRKRQEEQRRREDLEKELQWERDKKYKQDQAPIEDDSSKYESATREDLEKAKNSMVREVDERLWIKQNPDKFDRVKEYLPQFLKQRPHLASAIDLAPNRYEEAFLLMDALSPKQQKELKSTPVKRDAPGSPSSIPKAAALNQAVDLMSMNDAEFQSWRKSQRKSR